MLVLCDKRKNMMKYLAASKSQSYLVWKNSPSRFLGQLICTTSSSISSDKPFSRGSAIIVTLFLMTVKEWYKTNVVLCSTVLSFTLWMFSKVYQSIHQYLVLNSLRNNIALLWDYFFCISRHIIT